MGNAADNIANNNSNAWTVELEPELERKALRFCRRRGITMAQLIAGVIMWDIGVSAARGITATCST